MNRRSTLAILSGKRKSDSTRSVSLLSSSLNPYTGSWNYEHAAHLLRRTIFGPTKTQIDQAVADGLSFTIDQLFASQPLPEPPIHFIFDNDPGAAVGETWVDAPPFPDVPGLNGARYGSLYAWSFGLMQESGISIREKMTLFWHNHFVVADINDPRYTYKYSTTLRENALGNFRELVKKITIDPAMLIYLNGTQSTAIAPNENYARELLELFTIGKGALAGPGDYTTFTEDDVVQMARVLTGWIARGQDPTVVESNFVPFRHDTGTKQLSPRFGSVEISNAGDQEYSNLVDIIFQQDEVARFISRKLYRWFVHYTIDDTIENDIIEPMAQLIIDNDYEIELALRALLSSEHFFNAANFGCAIKHPIDFLFGLINTLEVPMPDASITKYFVWRQLYRVIIPLEMVIFNHPTVAGWKAFYQEPLYYRIWINSASLPVRMELAIALARRQAQIGDNPFGVDVLTFISQFDNPLEVDPMIDEFSRIVFARELTQNQKDYLKDVLIPGLPDFEWNVEYSEYLSDPDNEDLRRAVESKLQNMLQAMVSMAEYQLS